MGCLILDASVLIALLDRADPHYARAVEDVEAADQIGDDLVAPASAYSEALVAFARESRVDDAREAILAMGVEVAPLDAATAELAAALRARHDRLATAGCDGARDLPETWGPHAELRPAPPALRR